ncbi:N,N'-diacetyllegionaminic acid synthase [Tenacibaculum jejuense]|uniref:N,N'-diacetyllegionaminic acid synthase n=2 Tax=Tenacibaculum jejuense TaxID=584609 RepID=A0A238U6T5_9FLAO|nr:N,N'-diacetyllegionaminic acid synthase [Tenacibaculum jejuense]
MMKKTLIIAEAGVNHNGSITTAKQLIDVAVEAKVDLVKFQTFKADVIVSKTAKKADYQIKNTKEESDSQYEMLKKLELSHEDHLELISYCKEKGIEFFSTAFDVDGIDYLESLDFRLYKIPSGEITNYPYIKSIAQKRKPVIVSTGMCNLSEIEQAIKILIENGLSRSEITILHCNTEYPTPMKDVNLKAMKTIEKAFGVKVGYSDHTLGIEVPIAAVALGATVIEKHFTLDRNLPGPDHRASLEPQELKDMVYAIRNIEEAVSGNGIKEPSESEKKNKKIARKSIHLKNELKEGQIIKEEDLQPLRPGDGISTMQWNQVIGRRVSGDLNKFHKLKWSDLI